jgi:hypothetical protein
MVFQRHGIVTLRSSDESARLDTVDQHDEIAGTGRRNQIHLQLRHRR